MFVVYCSLFARLFVSCNLFNFFHNVNRFFFAFRGETVECCWFDESLLLLPVNNKTQFIG